MQVHPQESITAIRRDPQQYPRLKDTDPDLARNVLYTHILRCYNMKKQPVSMDELRAMTNMVYDLLMTDTVMFLRSITFEEIGRAINRGILKGELYGMSAADFAHVIAEYFSQVSMPTAMQYT